ncbi:hypothetical protein OH491_09475 [Termitidicoccus mucosus]
MILASITTLELKFVDYLIIGIYFAFVLGIGWVLRRQMTGTKDYLESGRSLPAWICALGFIGANSARRRSWAWPPRAPNTAS